MLCVVDNIHNLYMFIKLLTDQDQKIYESVIIHPVQTWVWGEFQKSQGHTIFRFGVFDNNNKIKSAFTLSFHKIPKTKFSIGTILRGPKVDESILKTVKEIAQKENAIFCKT